MPEEEINKNKYFLATTALEEFWDTSKQIVFLGPWCKRPSRKSVWEPLGASVVPPVLDSVENIKKAHDYTYSLYEKLLPIIAKKLNIMHGTQHGLRYWQIIIGPWLYYYVCVIYDRYLIVRSAQKHYPEFSTILLAENSFITPENTPQFINLINSDAYNLQIISRIITAAFAFKYTRKKYDFSPCLRQKNVPKNKFKSAGKNIIDFLMKKIGAGNISIVLKEHYFPLSAAVKIMLASFFKIRIIRTRVIQLSDLPFDEKSREILSFYDGEKDEFMHILFQLVALDMPKVFVEGYRAMQKEVEKIYTVKPRAIFSAISSYFDEGFKYWSAAAAEDGVMLLGLQHGGNYGNDAWVKPFFDHEISISNYYYTWGWNNGKDQQKVKPFPAPKIIGKKKLGADNAKHGVLFAITDLARYPDCIHHFNRYYFDTYLNWQKRFAGQLLPQVRKQLIVRMYKNEDDPHLKEEWKNLFPEIRIEHFEVPFIRRIQKCRLYVCDHLSTTHAESLGLNKPTILFWDPKIYPLLPEAKPIFEGLRSAGILFDNPEDAARAVNLAYDDVEAWWNDARRQKAVHDFCVKYARTAPHALNIWMKEFKQICRSAGKDRITL